MLVGYARVSTVDQNRDLQKDALKKAGCEQYFSDAVSGVKVKRPGLQQCLDYVREGDTIVIWRLDRLGRSVKELASLFDELNRRGVQLKSLTENLDTTTPDGKASFFFLASLAEAERNAIVERTKAGLAAARERGRLGGRPPKIYDRRRLDGLMAEYERQELPVKELCKRYKISAATFYRYLNRTRNGAVELLPRTLP